MRNKSITGIAVTCWVTAGLLMGCAGISANGNGNGEPENGDTVVAPAGPKIPYETIIAGIDEEPDLAALLRRASMLVELEKRPPTTVNGLLARADRDIERLLDVLHSEGYYAAKVTYRLDHASTPRTITMDVDPGDTYLLAEFNIEYRGAADAVAALPRDIEVIPGSNVHIGIRARARDLVAAERALVRRLTEIGSPQAKAVSRHVVLNHDFETVRFTVTVDPGPAAHFGNISFEGLETVEESFIRNLIPWRSEAIYDARQVEAYRMALNRTGLFRAVEISPASAVRSDGRLDLVAKVPEAKHRSIGAKLGYSTDEGFNGSAFWEHRNFFGRNERLRFSTSLSLLEQRIDADFRKPNFLRQDQSLLASAGVHLQEFDAYTERGVTTFLGLERKLSDIWTVTAGVAPEISRQKNLEESQTILLFGFPVSATRDTSDDALDPKKGSRTTLKLTPYFGTIGDNVSFLRGEISGSHYLGLDDKDRFVLAGRYYYGTIFGEETNQVPSSKRLFSGGGGSVRGYKFQSVGPLQGGVPVGGRSALELGLEMRIRITDTLGLVPFVDGGQVEDDMFIGDVSNMQYAAGLGFRYFTAVGPLRLDIAFPINRRKDVDSLFEFYVSLGQSF